MQVDEIDVVTREVRLSGTVWAPDLRIVTSALVLVGGSGPSDRTNAGYFDALRDRFVAAGVTVVAFDKRGVGRSTGAWASAGVDELAGDLAAGVEALRVRPRIDRDAVGVFGHSEGGWVALRACANGVAARYLVLNSCPAVSFVDAEVHALATAGVAIDRGRAVFERLRAAARTDDDPATARRVVALARERDPVLSEVLNRVGFRITDENWSQLRAWIDYAPEPDLRSLSLPTLAIYGSEDPLVPVKASERTLAALAPTARFEVFAGADHRLCIDGRLAPGYLDTLTAWCVSTL